MKKVVFFAFVMGKRGYKKICKYLKNYYKWNNYMSIYNDIFYIIIIETWTLLLEI